MFLILHPWAALALRLPFAVVAATIAVLLFSRPVPWARWRRVTAYLFAMFWLLVAGASLAFAADASATTTTFTLAPLLPVLTPLALGVLAGVIKWALGDVALLAAKFLHVKISQADQDAAAGYLDTLAEAAVSKAEGNLATATFTDDHPIVDGIAKRAAAVIPDLIAKAGWTKQRVTDETLAALGRAQIQMTRVSAPSGTTVAAPNSISAAPQA
jgi:hypothetical protein